MAYSNEMIDKRLASSYFFVAEDEIKIFGFANFSPVDSKGKSELNAIYLYPSYLGKGISTALFQKGLMRLKM